MAQLVLYSYWRSSSSYRVRFGLAAKGLRYEQVAVNLILGEQRRDEHLARSAAGYVPCLVVDGVPVIESVAILELLDDLFPDGPLLYPRDPWARARVRQLVEVINAGTQPLQNLAVLERLRELHGKTGSDEAEERARWARHFMARGLGAFERLMKAHEARGFGGRYAHGDALTAADCFLVPQMYNAQRFGLDLAPYPRAVAAAESALASPAAQEALPERQPDATTGAPTERR